MHAMAKALLEWETIDAEQIDDIAKGREPKPPKDTLKSGPENDGGNSSNSGGGSGAKSGKIRSLPRDFVLQDFLNHTW